LHSGATRDIGAWRSSSSSQVRNVLKAAAGRGLLTLTADGKIDDCTPLVDLFGANVARELAFYSIHLGIEI
jgi:hypothetical protein